MGFITEPEVVPGEIGDEPSSTPSHAAAAADVPMLTATARGRNGEIATAIAEPSAAPVAVGAAAAAAAAPPMPQQEPSAAPVAVGAAAAAAAPPMPQQEAIRPPSNPQTPKSRSPVATLTSGSLEKELPSPRAMKEAAGSSLDITGSQSRASPVPGAEDEFDMILSEVQCPICLDTYSDPVTLPCGHTICKDHVAELASMYNHPDTGIIEFDCPKCRNRINFASQEDVKVNLEMKNMMAVIKKAAKKSLAQRRSEREQRLLQQLKKHEESVSALRKKEQQLENERRQFMTERKKFEEKSTAEANKIKELQQQQKAGADLQADQEKLLRERQRLERERKLVEQQRSDINKRAHELLAQHARLRADEGGWEKQGNDLTDEELERRQKQLLKMKREAEARKEKERLERERRLEQECGNWLMQTQRAQRTAAEERARLNEKLDAMAARIEQYSYEDASGGYRTQSPPYPPLERAQPSTPPYTPSQAGHRMSDPSIATFTPTSATSTTFAKVKQFPGTPDAVANGRKASLACEGYGGALQEGGELRQTAPDPAALLLRRPSGGSPVAVNSQPGTPNAALLQHFQTPGSRVNPLTGFPDPRDLLGDDEDAGWRPNELNAMAMNRRGSSYKLKSPDEYYNHQFDDGVDHELEEVMQRTDEQYKDHILEARRRRLLSEKARIAEERAMAMLGKFRGKQAKPPPKPTFKPKLARRQPIRS